MVDKQVGVGAWYSDGSVTGDSGLSSSSSVGTVVSEKLSPLSRSFHVGQRHRKRRTLMTTACDDADAASTVAETGSYHRRRSDDAEQHTVFNVLHPSPTGLLPYSIPLYRSIQGRTSYLAAPRLHTFHGPLPSFLLFLPPSPLPFPPLSLPFPSPFASLPFPLPPLRSRLLIYS